MIRIRLKTAQKSDCSEAVLLIVLCISLFCTKWVIFLRSIFVGIVQNACFCVFLSLWEKRISAICLFFSFSRINSFHLLKYAEIKTTLHLRECLCWTERISQAANTRSVQLTADTSAHSAVSEHIRCRGWGISSQTEKICALREIIFFSLHREGEITALLFCSICALS